MSYIEGSMKYHGDAKVSTDSDSDAYCGEAPGPSGLNGVGKIIMTCIATDETCLIVGNVLTSGTDRYK